MNQSTLTRLRWSFVGYGISVALIISFIPDFFVDWRPGMLVWVIPASLAIGALVGVFAYPVTSVLLLSQLQIVAGVAEQVGRGNLLAECGLQSRG